MIRPAYISLWNFTGFIEYKLGVDRRIPNSWSRSCEHIHTHCQVFHCYSISNLEVRDAGEIASSGLW